MEKDITKKTYEVTYVALEDNLLSLEPALKKHGADMRNDDSRMSKVRLEFPIKKQEYGFFGVLVFEIAPEKISSLETDLRLSDKLLRFMITVYQPPRREPEKKPVGSLEIEPQKRSSFASERRENREYEKLTEKEDVSDEGGGGDDAVFESFAAVAPAILTNEDLERKIEEILQ